MTNTVQIKINRKTEVLAMTGLKKSTFYTRIKEGLLPPPIQLGSERTVGWIEHEVQAVLAAMCAGMPLIQIKELVQDLINQRTKL